MQKQESRVEVESILRMWRPEIPFCIDAQAGELADELVELVYRIG